MANNYTALSLNKTSKKFILARLNPARYISDDLVLSAGTTYNVTVPFISVNRVKVNGTEYTKVSSGANANEFVFDESTKLLSINLGAALTTQRVIAYHYLFFSSLDNVSAQEEPLGLTGSTFVWRNRIKNDPSLGVDLSNVIQGYIKTSNINLDLENVDDYFDTFLGLNDSFSKKEVKVWHFLDSAENISLFYTGNVNGLVSGRTLAVNTDNAFQNLEQPAFFEGNPEHAVYDKEFDPVYTDIASENYGKPVRQIYSTVSTHEEIEQSYEGIVADQVIEDGFDEFAPIFRDTYEAINTSEVGDSFATGTNRNWGIYKRDTRVSATDQNHSETMGTVTLTDPFTYSIVVADSTKYRLSDSVFFNSTIDISNSAVVRVINSATLITVKIGTGGAVPATSGLIIRREISAVFLYDPALSAKVNLGWEYWMYLVEGTHFNRLLSLTSNYVSILLDSTLDTFFRYPVDPFNAPPLYPASSISRDCKLYFRRWSKDDYNHGTVVQTLIENTGLTVNAASITAANLTVKNLSFSIPFKGESQIKSTRYYLEKIMQSTGGYLSINSDNEVEYHLIDSPTSGDTKTSNEVMDNTFSKNIIYKDIINEITIRNDHNYITLDPVDTKNNNKVIDSQSQELHDFVSTEAVDHVLEDGSLISSEYLNLRKERRQLITYQSKIDATNIVGDDITYNIKNETNDNTIIKVSKDSKKQIITTTDFHGV